MSSTAIGTKGVPRADREDQIVQVAVVEFVARGYAGASVAAIAAGAGISKPLIYQYFGSKDGLYLACLHEVAGGLVDRLQQAQVREDDSVLSRVQTLQTVFEALEPRREAWRLLYDASLPSVGVVADAAQGYRAAMAGLAASGSERFLAARGLHDAADASALSAIWMGLVNSLVVWWLDHPEESAGQLTTRCHRLLAAILS